MNANTYLNAFKQGLATTPAALAALKTSLGSLNATQAANILCTKELSEAQFEQLLAATTLTEEEKKYIRLKYQVITADAADTASKTTTTFSWKAMTVAIWDNIKATVTWLATNPVGWLIMIGAAVGGAIALYNAFNVTIDEHIEKLQELDQEYESNESSLQSLQSELDTTVQRIRELEGMDTLTLVEQGELKSLKETNTELAREIALLKQRNEELEKARIEEAEEAWETMNESLTHTVAVQDPVSEMYTNKLFTDVQYAEYLMEELRKIEEQEDALWADGRLSDYEKKTADELKKLRTQYRTELGGIRDDASEIGLDISDALADRIAASLDPKYAATLLSETLPEILSERAIIDAYKSAATSSGSSSSSSSGSSNSLAAKLLADEEFDAWMDSAINMGFAVEKSEEAVMELVGAYLEAAEAAAEATDNTNQFAASIEKFTSFEDSFGKLADAYKEFAEDGVITADTMSELLEAFGDTEGMRSLINLLNDEGVTLNDVNVALSQVGNEYLNNSELLDAVTEDNYQYIAALLKSQGVINAEQVALRRLEHEKLKAQIASADFTNGLNAETEALLANAEALGASAEALELFAQIQRWSKVLQSDISDQGKAVAGSNLALYVDRLKNLGSSLFEYEWGANIAQSGAASGSGSGDPWLEAFEAEYNAHKHAVEMEQETLAEFYAWLEGANEKYFAGRTKYLEEYRKYAEEVFNGLRELAEDRVSDLEHHIFLWENEEGQEYKIVAAYQQIMAEAQKAMEEYRSLQLAMGRTESEIVDSEFYQEQQKIYIDAKKSLQDIIDSVNGDLHDGLQDLLDLTVEMIEKEKEDEIDALKEISDQYGEIISQRKELLQLAEKERAYSEEVADKTAELTRLQNKAASLRLAANSGDRQAALELGTTMEEIRDLQKELSELQNEHYIESTESALDKDLENFEQRQESKIAEIEAFLDDNEALQQEALNRLQNMNQSLFDQLMEYASHYTETTGEELQSMWNDALEAARKYGSFTAALNNTGEGVKPEDSVASMSTLQKVSRMKAYSAAWSEETSEIAKASFATAALELGNSIEGAWRDAYGVWWLNGKRLYEMTEDELLRHDGGNIPTFHSGGVVSTGHSSVLRQNELFAKVKDREIVLNESQQNNLLAMLNQSKPLTVLRNLLSLLTGKGGRNGGVQIDASVHISGALPDQEIITVIKRNQHKIADIISDQFGL